MKLVMLSGNSLQNQEWIYEARNNLGRLFDGTYVQEYQHWGSNADWINLEYEMAVLSQNVARMGGEYGIFAKSIGTVLAVQALWNKIVHPQFFMFLGVPLDYITRDYPQFREVLDVIKVPLTVIHNKNDKVGNAADVKKYLSAKLGDRGDYNFITTPGDTHDYVDFELIADELVRLKQLS